MPSVPVRDRTGADAGTVELDEAVFGRTPNIPLMHQVVTAQLAAARAGTQSTRTRSEVRGGGAKPWRQKGTGRARQGSIRSPQWRGGGVALGPKPRSYKQRTPKKMVRAALWSALSDRAADGRVVVISAWDLGSPSTKEAKATLVAVGATGRALVVLGRGDGVAHKSLRNLPEVHCVLDSELNAYDVLCSDVVVFTRETLPRGGTAVEALEVREQEQQEEAAGTAATPVVVAATTEEDEA
jgi:large subunit ribosomal protein L4